MNELKKTKSLLASLYSYFTNGNNIFYYNIGGHKLTLDELKNELLRGNKNKSTLLFKTLGAGDESAELPNQMTDPRIIFICKNFPEVPEHIECFDDPETLDEKFSSFLKDYFDSKVVIDTENDKIRLPKIIENYKYDIGDNGESVLSFILKYYQNKEIDDVNELLSKPNMIIKYE